VRPSRIQPGTPEEGKVITFKDGPRLLQDYLATHAKDDEYPEMTYQEWMDEIGHRKIEGQFVATAFEKLVNNHFAL